MAVREIAGSRVRIVAVEVHDQSAAKDGYALVNLLEANVRLSEIVANG
jgi:hypothetical protein